MKNKIICGDCRELIKEVNPDDIDLVIFDPPYNIGFSGYDKYTDTLDDNEYIKLIALFKQFKSVVIISYPEESFKYLIPAMGNPDHVGAWCYNSNINRRFRLINYFGCVPDYSKVKQPYKNPKDKRIKKLIENGSKGTNLYEWWSDIQLVKNVSKEKTAHPCPVPVKLIERILLLTTNKSDVILDPFMGSGTTAIAARNLDRYYMGFELSEKYCEIAKERLNNNVS